MAASKKAYDLDEMFARIRRAVAPHAQAAMFELAEQGHASVFEQLVACILSIRTLDEVSLPASLRLLGKARTAEALAKMTPKQIEALIPDVTFHEQKSHTIKAIAERTAREFGGVLPADFEVLTSFKGVGPKCANLALGVAAGQARIAVDIHVHRVTNRWGYVAAKTPEKTMEALKAKLPEQYRVEINRLLVPFGKHICTGTSPKCSTCPVLEFCRQVGVTRHR